MDIIMREGIYKEKRFVFGEMVIFWLIKDICLTIYLLISM